MSGWIKLHRSTLEWEWFKNHKTAHVFNYCLLKANFKDSKFQGIDVPAGSFISGRKVMAQETGLSEQEIRTALVNLKSTNNLTIKSTSKYSIISVVNWDKYQEDQPATQPAINQQSTTSKEGKKDKKERNNTFDFEFEEIWKIYPSEQPKGAKNKALEKYTSIRKKHEAEEIRQGVIRYAEFCKRTGQYNQHMTTWLNGKGWTEEWPVKEELSYIERLRRDSIHV